MNETTTTREVRVPRPRVDANGDVWWETFARCALRENYVVEASDNGGVDYWAMTTEWMMK